MGKSKKRQGSGPKSNPKKKQISKEGNSANEDFCQHMLAESECGFCYRERFDEMYGWYNSGSEDDELDSNDISHIFADFLKYQATNSNTLRWTRASTKSRRTTDSSLPSLEPILPTIEKPHTVISRVIGVPDVKNWPMLTRCLIAEFIGTLLLVLIGCMSIAFSKTDNFLDVVKIALTFGLIIATMVQSIGHVSGCHINPAVTCGLAISGHISLIKAVLYIVVQCLGAVVGAIILSEISPSSGFGKGGNLGVTTVSAELSAKQGFIVEAIITFVLILVVQSVCDVRRTDLKGSVGVAIGFAITCCHLAAIKYTGASMNPARSFGPALVSGIWDNHWVYWAGPILGGVVAGLIYTGVFRVTKGSEEDSYDFQSS
ncbi:aquaporin AQPcic isoform X2 [Bemisia tabaci]|uniref:aquaporin AQPcic isoform X2 n=1 Tax=Bemisia tabaci TaxID=7038 RepID=UPI003B281D67